MFDGANGDEFNQFMASRTSFSINPLSFPSTGNLPFSSGFEPYTSSVHNSELQKSHHQSKSKSPCNIDEDRKLQPEIAAGNLSIERERLVDPWSNDEALALLKVRSSMENWFPQFNWEHVSSKLLELGFRRSGEECKVKFEEETRHLNNNFRIFGELNEFCAVAADIRDENTRNHNVEEKSGNVDDDREEMTEEVVEKPMEMSSKSEEHSHKKRKRRDRFEMLKDLCEGVVKSMMAQQEEFQNKLIEDIVRRDEENIVREESWKNQELERMKKETEIRTEEQASAIQRHATIIDFLKKLSSTDQNFQSHEIQDFMALNMNPITQQLASGKNSIPSPRPSSGKDSNIDVKDDVGEKRWPREQVLALINLRCKLLNNSSENEMSREIGTKGPLWERISQGMLELGYKKSAKRCKEKWENINKYFRKTKNNKKKRAIDSRTCPYFHQLSCLYSEGTLVSTSPSPSPSNISEN